MGMKRLASLAFVVFTVIAAALAGPETRADEHGSPGDARGQMDGAHPDQLSDLTLLNFFSEGWGQVWAHRHRRTPDMALLRVTTNFLERELRLDYARTDYRNNPRLATSDLANALIAYGVNRRLMVEVISNYQWNAAGGGPATNGAGGGVLARFQLVDTLEQSYAFQVRVSPPNKGIGQTQTSVAYALSGWQDLEALAPVFARVGLYYSVQYENLAGQARPGARQNDLSYDVSVARTWTEPTTPLVGNFTTFLEAFGTTDLDGMSQWDTVVSLTPGIRFWFAPDNSLMGGVDVPLSHAPPFSAVYRVTYILNF